MNKYYLLFIGLCYILSCKDYKEDAIDPEKVVTSVIIQPNEIDADGESQSTIEVEFPIALANDKAIAEIRTSAGSFKESGKDLVTINGNLERFSDGTLHRIGRATLVSPNVEGEAIITTQIARYNRTDKIKLNQAYADSIIIETDKLALKKGPENTATITITLLRNRGRGKPSINSNVLLTLKDLQGNNHGIIQPASNQTGADGKCKFIVGRGVDTYNGPLVIKAMNQQSTIVLMNSIQILFVE